MCLWFRKICTLVHGITADVRLKAPKQGDHDRLSSLASEKACTKIFASFVIPLTQLCDRKIASDDVIEQVKGNFIFYRATGSSHDRP